MATDTQFTPGPWEVYHDGFSVASTDGHIISTFAEGSTTEEALANAKLIATAPEMYEALHNLTSILEALRDDQVSQHFRFGATEDARKDRARQLAVYIESNAEKVDDAVETASAVLAKVRAEQVPA